MDPDPDNTKTTHKGKSNSQFRIRFRLWHLLAMLAVSAVVLWGYTEYGVDRVSVKIERIHVVPVRGSDMSNVLVAFRDVEVDDELPTFDVQLHEVPNDCVLCQLKDGEVVRFRYQKTPVWIDFGKTRIWERKSESSYRKFWNIVLALPEEHAGRPEVDRIKEIVFPFTDGSYRAAEKSF